MLKPQLTLVLVALALGGCPKEGGVQGALAGAEVDATRVQIDTVSKALDTYYVRHRELPKTLDSLEAEGYVKRARLADAWGRPLHYEVTGRHAFWLCSEGPDRTQGTGDDVCNLAKKPAAVAGVTSGTEVSPPVGAAAGGQPLAGWIAFSGPGGVYEARFPGKPTTEETKLPSPTGEQLMRSAIFTTPSGDRAYVAAVVELQVPAGKAYDVKPGPDGGASGMVATVGATLDSSRDTTFEGLAGKEIAFHGSAEGASFKGLARIYIQDNPPRLWQVGAIVAGGEVDAVARAYVEAFKPIESHAKPAP